MSQAGGERDPVLPRMHHWLMSAALLFVVTLVVPVLAGLT